MLMWLHQIPRAYGDSALPLVENLPPTRSFKPKLMTSLGLEELLLNALSFSKAAEEDAAERRRLRWESRALRVDFHGTLSQFNLQTAYILLSREFFQISYPIPRLEKEEQKKRRRGRRMAGPLVLREEEREPNSELSAEEKHWKTCYSYRTTQSECRRKLSMTSPSDVPSATPYPLKLCGAAAAFEIIQPRKRPTGFLLVVVHKADYLLMRRLLPTSNL